ncbi:hypothetical protein AcW1_009577 [Taiwanofungus camphoratus]|nr:hypothetical protein AcW1_009577 [Antrodia cinnamomea]
MQHIRPCYLPPHWWAYVHPEGQVYFAHESSLRIVTEAYLYSPEVQEKISYWIQRINDLLLGNKISLPETVELFLELDDTTDSCLYYFVDHATRTEFWLEETPMDLLGLPLVVSDSHLQLVLEELYWCHIEFFPSHRIRELHLSCDELVTIFVHARADQMTSEYSTFPCSAEQCAQTVDLLNSLQRCVVNGHTVCVIARLWVIVSRHRVDIHYGQQHARLSRDQTILEAPPVRRSWTFASISRLLFHIPDEYVELLDALFVDNLVYVDQWRKFLQACQTEWVLCASWALGLTIINVLLLVLPQGSRLITSISLLTCYAALVSASILLLRHKKAMTYHAENAATYLGDARRETTGFQCTAVAFSLPKSLFLWALGTMSLQGLVLVADWTNVYVAAALVVLILLFGLFSQKVTLPLRWSEDTNNGSSSGFWRFFPRLRRGSPNVSLIHCAV